MGLHASTSDPLINPSEPKSYQEALVSPEADLWKSAMEEEYSSLIENGTWELTALPEGRTTVKSKWVFKIKPGYKDVAVRFKGRMVAKGYTQEHGIDYNETYAPVVKHTALRMVLSLVASLDLDMIQLDIKTAFLYSRLEEEIYMDQPEGFTVPGRETDVCRLIKSIYGLKQAPRLWNKKFYEFLVKFGLTRSTADPCVYFRRLGEEVTIVAIYVDDGLVCSNKPDTLTSILEFLGKEFQMRTLSADRFVGVNITRDRERRQLFFAQPHYITFILEKFNMAGCNIKAVPADPNARLSSIMSPTDEEEMAEMRLVPYREAIGSLIYLAVMTRPDISYAVGQVSQYCQNPGRVHWNAVKHIIAYLKKTINYGILFYKSQFNTLSGFSDADYAGLSNLICIILLIYYPFFSLSLL